MPDPVKKISPAIFKECENVFDTSITDPVFYPNKSDVLKLFDKKEILIEHTCNGKKLESKVLIFETNFSRAKETHTCLRVGGGDELLSLSSMRIMPYLSAFNRETDKKKNLRFIQISLFENFEDANGKLINWKPSNFEDIGKLIFSFLEGLMQKNISVDSMICHSLGGAVLEGLNSIDPKKVPKTLILDRAYTSTWKVGRQLMNPVLCYILYFLAYCSGWAGNPEYSLIRFFENQKKTTSSIPLSDRSVIIIEAEHDFFFSNHGAFDNGVANQLNKLGVNAFQQKFVPNPLRVHYRAHHACPIDYLINNNTEGHTGTFNIGYRQDVASAVVNNVFRNHVKMD